METECNLFNTAFEFLLILRFIFFFNNSIKNIRKKQLKLNFNDKCVYNQVIKLPLLKFDLVFNVKNASRFYL